MASLSFDKRKKNWKVDYRDPDGKRRRKFFKDRYNAKEFWLQVQNRQERLDNDLSYIEPVSFADAMEEFFAQYLILTARTYQATEQNRLKKLATYFDGQTLDAIGKAEMGSLVAARKQEGVSNQTITNDLSVLSSLFRWAQGKQPPYIRTNPVIEWKAENPRALKKLPRKVRTAKTAEELLALYEHGCDCCLNAWLILAETGLRVGEFVQLQKNDFDLENHCLVMHHTEDTPKKGKRDRVVPLTPLVEQIVAASPEGPIYQRGRRTLENHFKRAAKKADIDICLHELRHTYISNVVNSGLDLLTAQRIAGHSRISTTERYMHPSKDMIDKVRRVFGAQGTNSKNLVPSWCPPIRAKPPKPTQIDSKRKSGNIRNQILRELPVFQNERETGLEPATFTLAT